ncbi:hypothetical protein D3C81_1632660 [compost metagenome]
MGYLINDVRPRLGNAFPGEKALNVTGQGCLAVIFDINGKQDRVPVHTRMYRCSNKRRQQLVFLIQLFGAKSLQYRAALVCCYQGRNLWGNPRLHTAHIQGLSVRTHFNILNRTECVVDKLVDRHRVFEMQFYLAGLGTNGGFQRQLVF